MLSENHPRIGCHYPSHKAPYGSDAFDIPILGILPSIRLFSPQECMSTVVQNDYCVACKTASPSSKLETSSALSATWDHLTTPVLSIAKLPAVCHRLPLWVGLFQIPSCRPSLMASQRLHGLSTCQTLERPRPQAAYSSRLSSTII